jgi:anaerobic ribonucleoside-triphosphate reductase
MTKEEIPVEQRTRCEIYSRVMGYHRPVSEWNIGKQQEFADRQLFKEPSTLLGD